MKGTFNVIDSCYWSMLLLSVTQAVPVSYSSGYNGTDDYDVTTTAPLLTNQVCLYEDETYSEGQTRPSSNPCETCLCQPPNFTCEASVCDVKPGCKALLSAEKCCPDYVCDCQKNGRTYGNGEKVEEPNPCNVCYCRGGEIKCTGVTCYTRSDCEPHYVPGKCCPKYDHCPAIDMKDKIPIAPMGAEEDYNGLPDENLNPKEETTKQTTPLFEKAPENDQVEISTPSDTLVTQSQVQVGTLEIIEIYPNQQPKWAQDPKEIEKNATGSSGEDSTKALEGEKTATEYSSTEQSNTTDHETPLERVEKPEKEFSPPVPASTSTTEAITDVPTEMLTEKTLLEDSIAEESSPEENPVQRVMFPEETLATVTESISATTASTETTTLFVDELHPLQRVEITDEQSSSSVSSTLVTEKLNQAETTEENFKTVAENSPTTVLPETTRFVVELHPLQREEITDEPSSSLESSTSATKKLDEAETTEENFTTVTESSPSTTAIETSLFIDEPHPLQRVEITDELSSTIVGPTTNKLNQAEATGESLTTVSESFPTTVATETTMFVDEPHPLQRVEITEESATTLESFTLTTENTNMVGTIEFTTESSTGVSHEVQLLQKEEETEEVAFTTRSPSKPTEAESETETEKVTADSSTEETPRRADAASVITTGIPTGVPEEALLQKMKETTVDAVPNTTESDTTGMDEAEIRQRFNFGEKIGQVGLEFSTEQENTEIRTEIPETLSSEKISSTTESVTSETEKEHEKVFIVTPVREGTTENVFLFEKIDSLVTEHTTMTKEKEIDNSTEAESTTVEDVLKEATSVSDDEETSEESVEDEETSSSRELENVTSFEESARNLPQSTPQFTKESSATEESNLTANVGELNQAFIKKATTEETIISTKDYNQSEVDSVPAESAVSSSEPSLIADHPVSELMEQYDYNSTLVSDHEETSLPANQSVLIGDTTEIGSSFEKSSDSNTAETELALDPTESSFNSSASGSQSTEIEGAATATANQQDENITETLEDSLASKILATLMTDKSHAEDSTEISTTLAEEHARTEDSKVPSTEKSAELIYSTTERQQDDFNNAHEFDNSTENLTQLLESYGKEEENVEGSFNAENVTDFENVTATAGYDIYDNSSEVTERDGTREYTIQGAIGKYPKGETPEKILALPTTEDTTSTVASPAIKKVENTTATLAEILLKWLQSKKAKSDAKNNRTELSTKLISSTVSPINNSTKLEVDNSTSEARSDTPVSLLSALTTELLRIVHELPDNGTSHNTTKAREVNQTSQTGSPRDGNLRSLDLGIANTTDQSLEIYSKDIENLAEALTSEIHHEGARLEETDTPIHLKYPYTDESLAPVLSMISDQLQFLRVGEEQPMYVEPPPEEEIIRHHHQHAVVVVPTSQPVTVNMVKVDPSMIGKEGVVTSDHEVKT